ncbi:BTAD domain-containing putative transcriptional regulator [Actinomycetospora straminea]|uniref:BTAD domain-containing putative transcriptional regulator n=1 Tax=Actinomycetospora straminea TaxID=663607 RepID=UPI002366A624|nr:BTAD domain-containing putative transcriptional regulator [Actinomycetospora straminea]MDD7934083.1 BTAD domain-containing putative transcriptional regulator [Actinomycetospora straminea]
MGDDQDGPAACVDVLGPLRLRVGDATVAVRGPKRRAVLALLALAEGRALTVEQLVDALWPEEPPDGGRATVHSHVSRLRADLGPAAPRLVTVAGGYRLRLPPDALDLRRVRDLRDRARDLTDPRAAAECLRTARATWRGPALADLLDVPGLRAAADAARELWCDVTDRLVEALIAAGAADEALAPAADAVAEDPWREPAVLGLVRARAATGQAPRALQTAREYRRRLAEEAGLDPSPALAELERAVADGELAPAPVAVAPPAPPAPPAPTARTLHGRDAELATAGTLLGRERLVSVVGPGGVGKTRLARELAARAPAAATLLLAPVTDPAALPHALAEALRLRSLTGDVLDACLDELAGAPRLLLLDNAEHLLDGVRDLVATLLERAPGVTVLVTSREPLGLAEEAVVRLAPLAVPARGDRPDGLAGVPAVAVFLDRAARVRPDLVLGADELAHVADVVRRLDGLPLAIELAAGRLSTFAPAALAARLDRALDLLGNRGAPARHRTLRATVAWSYALLTPDEQRLFRHLTVFADGVDPTAVEAVADGLGLDTDAGELLARLVDASMVEADTGAGTGRTRYRVLETLRAYGRDELVAAGEADAAEAAVVRWAVDLATWVERTGRTAQEPAVDAVLQREHGNLRATWRLARTRGDLDAAAAMAVSLVEAATWRDLVEVRGWSRALLDDPGLAGHPLEARVLGAAGQDAYMRGEAPVAERLARAALARAPAGEDRRLALAALAQADLTAGRWDDAVTHELEAVAHADGPVPEPGVGALAALYAGDPARAREIVALLPAGEVPTLRGLVAYVTAEIDSVEGDTAGAERGYRTAITAARSVGSTFLEAIAAVGLASLLSRAGRIPAALVGYRDVIDHWDRGGNWGHQWVTLRNLADLLRELGDAATADLLDAAADRAPDAPDDPERPRGRPVEPAPDRHQALALARDAVSRHLGADSGVHAG